MSKTFRIFVSSTFSDLKAERIALQQYVFPRLRELCMQHGCRFQGIDLRWGVSEEAGRDQQTVNICLCEIKRCQRVTPRPNFIVLLGNRYGWRPLPSEIPANEFNKIKTVVVGDGPKKLLNQWYRVDDNAIPPVYCLLPRELGGRTGASDEERKDAAMHERVEWQKIEHRLREILKGATAQLGWPQDDLRRRKYETSATEQEVVEGALNVADAKEHVFGFFREIDYSMQFGERPLAALCPVADGVKPYLDLTALGHLDTEAVKRQELLKQRLRTQLPGHIHEYWSTWTGDGITTDHIGALPEKLEDCLKLNDASNPPQSLCADVWRRLSAIILKQIGQIESVDPLTRDNADHKAFGEERARHFVGRSDILTRIQAYVDGDESRPLIIYGRSGSGKTALMAKAGQECVMRNAERGTKVVSRFIGATPGSTDLRILLSDLCHALDVVEFSTDMSNLVKAFRDRLSPMEQGEKKEEGKEARHMESDKTVLFLDALEQLNSTDNARMLNWMPRDLKPNIKMVVSVQEIDKAAHNNDSDVRSESSKHSALSRRSGTKDDPFDIVRRIWPQSLIEVGPLDETSGAGLLDKWLKDAGRTLQSEQKSKVLGNFRSHGMPLYLKLVFEEARRWHSYDPVPELPADPPSLIQSMLDRLTQPENHGEMLVSRALGYLAAAKNGLTEDELLDLLAHDDEYWKYFCEHVQHTDSPLARSERSDLSVKELKDVAPQDRRLPVIIWSRLYHDLERYLTERSADNTTLFSFYHRQFAEVVDNKYLPPDLRLKIHERLATYFANQNYWLESIGAQRARAQRLPPTPRPANIRKVVELPYHRLESAKLAGGADPNSPYWDAVADLLTDWRFLEAKAEADPYLNVAKIEASSEPDEEPKK